MPKFNLLKDAYLIKNTDSCVFDSLNGYISDFSTNGDVNGWDIYSNIVMYGSWNSVLFGTSTDKSCFISRTNPFVPINAEKYYMLKITMKITSNCRNVQLRLHNSKTCLYLVSVEM